MAEIPGVTVDWAAEPRIITIPAATRSVSAQDLVDTLRAIESDIESIDDVDTLVYSAEGKTALDDIGGKTAITVTLNNAQLYFEPVTTPLAVGTATSGASPGGRSITLTDSTATFITDGAVRGCVVFNATSGAMATVLSAPSETQIESKFLSGGSRDTWLLGDAWVLYGNEQASIVGGNVVSVDAGLAYLEPVLSSPLVQVVRSSSASGTLQELEAIQYASFNDGVTIDVANGAAGVLYPQGTPEHPVNNLADALTIATARGFLDLFIRGDLTIGATESIANYHLHGQGATINVAKTTLTLTAGCTTSDAHFHNLRVEGTQGGEVNFYDCVIGAVFDAHCYYDNCLLIGPITQKAVVGATHTTDMQGCRSGVEEVVIDQNGAQTKKSLTNFSGRVKFTNGTDAGAIIIVNLDAGVVTLDSTCTAGTYIIRGTGQLINNAAGAIVSAAALSSEQFATQRYTTEALRLSHQGFGEVFFVDPVSGLDTNLGTSPVTAKRTVVAAMADCVSGRGDVIYLVSPGAGVATITEQITISKNDIFIRGTGRGVQFQPAAPLTGPVITIEADNCSLASFIVRAPSGSTADDCIVVNGKFSRIDKVYVVGTQTGTGNGIVYRGGDYHELHNAEIEKCGGDGVLFTDAGLATGSPREVTITGGNIYLNNGNGVNLTGTSANSTRLNRMEKCRISQNTGYGIRLDANVQDNFVDVNLFLNTAGSILDGGTRTTILDSSNPWSIPTSGNETAGSMGERTKKIFSKAKLIPGAL